MGIWKVVDGMAFKLKSKEHIMPGGLVDDQRENIRRQIQKVQPVDDAAKKTYEGFKKGVWSVYDPIKEGPEITKEDIKRDQDLSGNSQEEIRAKLDEQGEESKEGTQDMDTEEKEKPEDKKESTEEKSEESTEPTKTEGQSTAPNAPPADKAIPGVSAKKSE